MAEDSTARMKEVEVKPMARTSQGTIALVPYVYAASITKELTDTIAVERSQPSSDSQDPLNWSTWKKNTIFATVCLGAFVGIASVNVHQLAYIRQASYYHKSAPQLSYSISAGVAGLVGGPLLLVPLSSIIGRSSLILWCLVGVLACNIWGPLMTGSNQYIPFILSRLFAGLFGAVPAILASGYIMDIYFLHQRGKAFAALEVCILAGVVFAPVFGGFIANSRPWPYVFWWLVALLGFSIIMSFCVLEDTDYQRDEKAKFRKPAPKSFMAGRVATFLPGTAVVPKTTLSHVGERYLVPFRIGFSPVTLLTGVFVLLIFGFAIGLGIDVSIFLQTPEMEGGYGFTPLQNAAFNFSQIFGLILCQICGMFLNDRLPLWVSGRNGGTWHPEYRLYNILLVIAAAPVGLGLFGAGLQYHLHYMVLALGTFFVMFAATYSTPISVNYITECFTNMSLEVAVAMNVYRQAFGLALPFFVFPWQAAVGSGWLFGTMAFLCILVSFGIGILIWKGQALRQYSLVSASTEDGVKLNVCDAASASALDSSSSLHV